MITVENFEFPETVAEAASWDAYYTVTTLHSNVMAFAHVRMEQAWTAYIFPVPGLSHREEWRLWKTEGNKLPEHVARAIFGTTFGDLPYVS